MEYALMKAIYVYRADWNAYMAATMDDDDAPLSFKPSLAVLETWEAPATSTQEAVMALELAVEFYDVGTSPVIPAMMKSALGWIKADAERRAAE